MNLIHIICVLVVSVFAAVELIDREERAASCPRISGFPGRVKYRRRGTKAYFRCPRKTRRYGPKFITCQSGRTWDGEPPKCIKSGCVPVDISTKASLDMTEMYGGALLRFTCEDEFQLIGQTEVYCDGRRWSSAIPSCVATTELLECDFEDDLCGWSQDNTDDAEWIKRQGQTPTGGTGPKHDHTFPDAITGHYIYYETSSPAKVGENCRLLSPVYTQDFSNMCFEFWYHMLGPDGSGHVGLLDVFVRRQSEFIDDIQPVFTKHGNQGDVWHRGEIYIDAMDEPYQIVMMATRKLSYISDIAVDDVRLFNCSKPTSTPVTTTTTTSSTTTTVATTTTTTASTTTTMAPSTTIKSPVTTSKAPTTNSTVSLQSTQSRRTTSTKLPTILTGAMSSNIPTTGAHVATTSQSAASKPSTSAQPVTTSTNRSSTITFIPRWSTDLRHPLSTIAAPVNVTTTLPHKTEAVNITYQTRRPTTTIKKSTISSPGPTTILFTNQPNKTLTPSTQSPSTRITKQTKVSSKLSTLTNTITPPSSKHTKAQTELSSLEKTEKPSSAVPYSSLTSTKTIITSATNARTPPTTSMTTTSQKTTRGETKAPALTSTPSTQTSTTTIVTTMSPSPPSPTAPITTTSSVVTTVGTSTTNKPTASPTRPHTTTTVSTRSTTTAPRTRATETPSTARTTNTAGTSPTTLATKSSTIYKQTKAEVKHDTTKPTQSVRNTTLATTTLSNKLTNPPVTSTKNMSTTTFPLNTTNPNINTVVVQRSKHPEDETLKPLLIGLGVGIVVGLIIIGVVAYVCVRRRKFYTSRYEDELKPITKSTSEDNLENVQYEYLDNEEEFHI